MQFISPWIRKLTGSRGSIPLFIQDLKQMVPQLVVTRDRLTHGQEQDDAVRSDAEVNVPGGGV